jgi:hypothetical protein
MVEMGRTGAEGSVAGSLEDDELDGVVLLGVPKDLPQLLDHVLKTTTDPKSERRRGEVL